ncbi:type III pantothenate kinase [Marinobacter sp. X15-166B]|uniref:type III pantothenate kinase n=1 Tax=Marinobacter sp. X15-166B TaxID=1897620 RepID=UPI00085C8488|nr:type III pantothenate kinase [Marinobacter sp. X15-166B]OEY66533.1 hypothetical protein BG841_08730 [Marinobacter sp. X15-166B]
MKLFIDMGNTFLKWQLRRDSLVVGSGRGEFHAARLFDAAKRHGAELKGVEVSSVAAEERQQDLVAILREWTPAPVRFHWTEAERNGLVCAYQAPETMGVDRWHALYGCWAVGAAPFMVVDAGSAVTVDVVGAEGRHLGGYILPGRGMMLRSLRRDVARVGFGEHALHDVGLGKSTSECVYHGFAWMWQGMVEQVKAVAAREGIARVYITGGDASQLIALGLEGWHEPDLVINGLAAVVAELDQG